MENHPIQKENFSRDSSTTLEPDEINTIAQQVCWNCKVGKRKCSKELPGCARCSKLLMKCDYNYSLTDTRLLNKDKGSSPSSNPDDSALQPLQTASMLMQSISSGPHDLYLQNASITNQVLNLLVASGESIPSISSTYFNTIDSWLPIISPEQCLKKLQALSSGYNVEVANLLLSMYLITRQPAAHEQMQMQSTLYFEAKTLHTLLISTGRSSIEILQAGLLISLYEIGHGINDAAQLTMAICVRMATKIKAQQVAKTDLQNTEFGLLWWGVVTLDRFVVSVSVDQHSNLTRSRYMNQGLNVDEIYLLVGIGVEGVPSMDLPTDDAAHAALPRPITRRTASGISAESKPTTRLGPFCRAAEAGQLLGNVLELVAKSCHTGEMDREVCGRLDSALLALAMDLMQQAINGWEECCAAIGLCLSALLLLHERTCELLNAKGVEGERFEAAMMALSTATRMVIDISRRFHMDVAFINLPALPLPATYAVYRASLLYIRFAGDDLSSPEGLENIKSLKGTLEHFGKRWGIGKHYIKIVEDALRKAGKS